MTSVLTQAEIAKAAVASCGSDSAERQAACDRISASLADLSQTCSVLKTQTEAKR